jgi:hypothetical protein
MLKEEHVEILVEESSMERFLQHLLPDILPDGYILGQNCFIRPHSGKTDLMKSISKKARAFKHFPHPVRMVVVHDQDSNNCIQLKKNLIEIVKKENPDIPLLVRIACRELENWYLGDLEAIEKLYPESKARNQTKKAKFRDPDNLNGTDEMRRFSSLFSKQGSAKEIPKHMNLSLNRSTSFNHFITGIKKFLL